MSTHDSFLDRSCICSPFAATKREHYPECPMNPANRPVADERQVAEIAEEYALEFDSVIVSPPDSEGRVKIVATLDDVEMRITVVSPDGTVTPSLTPTERGA